MFHAAKSLVLLKGFREKSHMCLLVALRHLYVDAGLLGKEHAERFEQALDLRHQADYGLEYAREDAQMMLDDAGAFNRAARKLFRL